MSGECLVVLSSHKLNKFCGLFERPYAFPFFHFDVLDLSFTWRYLKHPQRTALSYCSSKNQHCPRRDEKVINVGCVGQGGLVSDLPSIGYVGEMPEVQQGRSNVYC